MKNFLTATCTALTLAITGPVVAEELTVYDLPSKYMNWAGLVEAYEAKTGIRPTLDLKNGSSTALAALKLEAANPIANAAFWSLDIASEAKVPASLPRSRLRVLTRSPQTCATRNTIGGASEPPIS